MASFQMLNTHSTSFLLLFFISSKFFLKGGKMQANIRFLFRLPDDDNSSTTRSVYKKKIRLAVGTFYPIFSKPIFLFVCSKKDFRTCLVPFFSTQRKKVKQPLLFSPKLEGTRWQTDPGESGVARVEQQLQQQREHWSCFLISSDSFRYLSKNKRKKPKVLSVEKSDLKLFSIF